MTATLGPAPASSSGSVQESGSSGSSPAPGHNHQGWHILSGKWRQRRTNNSPAAPVPNSTELLVSLYSCLTGVYSNTPPAREEGSGGQKLLTCQLTSVPPKPVSFRSSFVALLQILWESLLSELSKKEEIAMPNFSLLSISISGR